MTTDMRYSNSYIHAVEEVVELTNKLANEVMFDRIIGKEVTKNRISILLRVAIIFHENDIPWPALLREVISWQVDLVGLEQNLPAREIIADQHGPLRGGIDGCSPEIVMGWAQDTLNPERPVLLEIVCGDIVVGSILSDNYRQDLQIAQIGSGNHSFVFKIEPHHSLVSNIIKVRRAADGALLSEKVMFSA